MDHHMKTIKANMNLFKALRTLSFALFVAHTTPIFAAAHPTMILVHGALFTSSVWLPVQTYLQNKGYNVVTVDTPGRLHDGVSAQNATLHAAVEKVCQVANLQAEPVILVGHNQAGAIITQAIANCGPQIQGLVYIAAVVPWPGEKPFDLLSDQDNKNFDKAAPLDHTTGLSIPDYQAPIQDLLMADASTKDAQHAIMNMVPEPIIFAYDTLDYNLMAFNQIPKFYIKTMNDVMISPSSQDIFINRQAMNQIKTLLTSHCPFISQPTILGDILSDINNSFTKSE